MRRILGLILATYAGAELSLAQLALPNATIYAHNHALSYVAVGAVALLGLSEGTSLAAGRLQQGQVADYEEHLKARLVATLLTTRDVTGLSESQIGVHVFMTRRRRSRRLHRVGGLRISAKPSLHRPKWKIGKGIVGRAAATNQYEGVDWQALVGYQIPRGAALWRELDQKTRYGMNWGELNRSEEYERIAARPVYGRSGNLIGAVVVDSGTPYLGMESLLDPILRLAAREFGTLGRPPFSWWTTGRS